MAVVTLSSHCPFSLATLTLAAATAWLLGQSPSGDPLIEGLRTVEVASVADAYEQLYDTADQKEGMSAFLQKRKPAFEGK